MPVIPLSATGTTFGDLIEEVRASLHAYTSDVEEMSTLTTACSPLDLTLVLDNTLLIDRGLIEIDDELIYLLTVNTTNGTATVPPWGRGQQGSDAVAHSAGARIISHPRFPRARVGNVINQVVASLDTELFAVREYEFIPSTAIAAYDLPVDLNLTGILSVNQMLTGPSQVWRPIRRWRLDQVADPSAFSGGKSLTVVEGLEPGRTVKVTYTTGLQQFNSLGDTITLSGLAENARDILVLGAMARLLMTADASRLQTSSVEESQRSQFTQIPAGTSTARALQAAFVQRVMDERMRLLRLYPAPTSLTR